MSTSRLAEQTAWLERVLGWAGSETGQEQPESPQGGGTAGRGLKKALEEFLAFQKQVANRLAEIEAQLADEDLGEIDRAAALSDMHELREETARRVEALNAMTAEGIG